MVGPPLPSAADVCDSLDLPIIDSLPVEPSPVVDWSLEGLESFKAHNAHVSAVHELVEALQVWPARLAALIGEVWQRGWPV